MVTCIFENKDMRIIDGFKLRQICGENVVVPEGADLVNFNKMLSLNETAAFLWKSVEGRDFDESILAGLLVQEYGIDENRALEDTRGLLSKWREVGVVK